MAEIARGERFSLLALEGITINPASQSAKRQTLSYCIVDRTWNHKEVWHDYSDPRGTGHHDNKLMRRSSAFNKLDELEAWEKTA